MESVQESSNENKIDFYRYFDLRDDGTLLWKISTGPAAVVGSEAGTVQEGDDRATRRCVQVLGRRFLSYRVVWEMVNGPIPDGYTIDHIDGDSLNDAPANLRAVPEAVNLRNRKKPKNNTSGVVGVELSEKHGYTYWNARWMKLDGKVGRKVFRIESHGNEEAFQMACAYRTAKIEELNRQGAGYTDRHGT